MIGLSRQFRDKSSDYWSFDLTTVTTNKTMAISIELAQEGSIGGPVSSGVKVGVNWGDGSPGEELYQTTNSITNHTYGATGTYNVKVYMREPKLTLMGFLFNTSSFDYGTLDFTGYKALSQFGWAAASTATVTLPDPNDFYLNPNVSSSFEWRASSSAITITNLTNNVLDISPYGAWNWINDFSNTTSYNRVKFPTTNLDTSSVFYCRPNDGLEAVGPSASDLNNWNADFTNQNIYGQFHLRGTGITGATGNIQQLIIPSEAFGSIGIREILFQQLGCTSIDLTQIPWWNISSKTFQIDNCPNLQEINFPGPTVSNFDQFYRIYIMNNDLQGHIDLSSFGMLETTTQVQVYTYNNPGITQLTFPNYPNMLIRSINVNDCGLTAMNGFENYTNFDTIQCTVWAFNNNLPASEINKILVTVDNGSTIGFASRQCWLYGGTNAAPDGSSGGYDGVTAKANLITKGWSVNTN